MIVIVRAVTSGPRFDRRSAQAARRRVRRFVRRLRVRCLAVLRLLAVRLRRLVERFLRGGTFDPSLRASESPMAIACLRLVTFMPERPLRSMPRLRSRMVRATFFDAFLLYFLAISAPIVTLSSEDAARTVPPRPPPGTGRNAAAWHHAKDVEVRRDSGAR